MVSTERTCPCSPRQASLHPVRNPGSIAMIRLLPSGGDKSNCSTFLANTSIEIFSAFNFIAFRTSVSIDGLSNLLYASWIASSTWPAASPLRLTKSLYKCSNERLMGGAMDTARDLSFTPLNTAKTL